MATESPAANTAVVASVGVAARANQSRQREKWQGMLETAPGELSVYYGERFKRPTCRIRRATYRTDGFVSVHAGYGGGQMVTKSLTFAGDELVMNFSTPAVGGVRAEVQDGDGRPIPGYELHKSSEIFGDAIEQTRLLGREHERRRPRRHSRQAPLRHARL